MQGTVQKQYVKCPKTLILLLLATTLIFSIPTVYADNTIQQDCSSGIITITAIDAGKHPIIKADVRIYSDLRGLDLTNTIRTDSNGQASFEYSEKTQLIIVNEDRLSQLEIIPCIFTEPKKQSMIIFSTSDSHIGIFEEDGITIVDLGTIFGIAGSGSIPDKIIVTSKQINTTIPNEAISPSSTHGDWQLSQVYFTEFSNQGIYTLDLVTDEKITYTFSFEVRQVVEQIKEEESQLEIENRELREENVKLQSQIDEMILEIEALNTLIREKVNVILEKIMSE